MMHKSSKIFIAFLVVAAATFTYSLYVGKNQIQVRKDDYSQYIDAVQRIEEGVELEESLATLDRISLKYGSDSSVLLNKVLGYSKLGEFDSVEKSIEELLKLEESLEDDSEIMLLYAKAIIENGNKGKAKEILDKIIQLELDASQIIILNELTERIG